MFNNNNFRMVGKFMASSMWSNNPLGKPFRGAVLPSSNVLSLPHNFMLNVNDGYFEKQRLVISYCWLAIAVSLMRPL